jgi:hypothetical protein
LSIFSESLALFYFKTALGLCRLTGVQLSLLLHPLDFLGCDDVQELSFFPAMKLSSTKKLRVVSKVLHLFSSHFDVVTMQQHALAVAQTRDHVVREPDFESP